MRALMLFVVCAMIGGCGLHANPAVWAAHDRIFECEYNYTEPVMTAANQRLALTAIGSPLNTCDHWAFSSTAPRRMVYDCIEFLNNSVDCQQLTSRMFQCDACYVSWRNGR